MRIHIATDHAGLELSHYLIEQLTTLTRLINTISFLFQTLTLALWKTLEQLPSLKATFSVAQ